MPVNPRRRQRKLERNRAKEIARRRELARHQARGLASRVKTASSAPILHCCVMEELWDVGIGHVLISRELDNGAVVFACFLIDCFCLGVKDAFVQFAPRSDYEERMYRRMVEQYAVVPLRPESARRLVENAVDYAANLGFAPHHDYEKARQIFGDISADACTEVFEFGKDGKPHFVAGPHDSPTRCSDIVRTLHDRCGPGGYHFTVPFPIALPDSFDRRTLRAIPVQDASFADLAWPNEGFRRDL